jgi:hypothetical protein
MPDLIADLMARLAAALEREGGRPRLAEVEQQLRLEWGGRWVYVAARPRSQTRAAYVAQALRLGQDPSAVACSFGVSVRHVRRIKATLKR